MGEREEVEDKDRRRLLKVGLLAGALLLAAYLFWPSLSGFRFFKRLRGKETAPPTTTAPPKTKPPETTAPPGTTAPPQTTAPPTSPAPSETVPPTSAPPSGTPAPSETPGPVEAVSPEGVVPVFALESRPSLPPLSAQIPRPYLRIDWPVDPWTGRRTPICIAKRISPSPQATRHPTLKFDVANDGDSASVANLTVYYMAEPPDFPVRLADLPKAASLTLFLPPGAVIHVEITITIPSECYNYIAVLSDPLMDPCRATFASLDELRAEEGRLRRPSRAGSRGGLRGIRPGRTCR